MRPLHRLLPRDPRDLQIAFLASFLVLGVAFLGLQVEPWMPPVLLASTCAVQWACERLLGLPSSGFRSPLITGLGLSLLLRTDAVWVPPLAATLVAGDVGLIRFDTFEYVDDQVRLMREALQRFDEGGVSGWIVDLRGRPLAPFDGSFELGAFAIATVRVAG